MNKEWPLRRHKTPRFFRRDNILALCVCNPIGGRPEVSKRERMLACSLFSLQMYKTVLSSFSRRFYRIKRHSGYDIHPKTIKSYMRLPVIIIIV